MGEKGIGWEKKLGKEVVRFVATGPWWRVSVGIFVLQSRDFEILFVVVSGTRETCIESDVGEDGLLLRSVFETILFQSRITRSRLSNFRNLSTVRDKVVDQPFLFNCLHKYISYRCAVGRRGEICNLCAKETSYVRFQKFLCSTNTRASKREIERERDISLKFWKKQRHVIRKKKNISANVSLGTIHSYVKYDDTRRNRGPDLCYVHTSLVAEGLKLLPDLIARVTSCTRM